MNFHIVKMYKDKEVNKNVTICRRSWYIAAHIWKIYDFKIEVPFIINFSTELTTRQIPGVSPKRMRPGL
jgi:hypothetical protein